jgi:hypothetical protein
VRRLRQKQPFLSWLLPVGTIFYLAFLAYVRGQPFIVVIPLGVLFATAVVSFYLAPLLMSAFEVLMVAWRGVASVFACFAMAALWIVSGIWAIFPYGRGVALHSGFCEVVTESSPPGRWPVLQLTSETTGWAHSVYDDPRAHAAISEFVGEIVTEYARPYTPSRL